jgi:uncharacterized protein
MICPKCESVFESIMFAEVTVQRCLGCKGIWFDSGTHEYLKGIDGSEALDTGDAKTGASNNEKGNYRCPKCSGGMIRLVDPHQPHIWYESCSECFGVYLDAGEFRDFKEKTVVDFLRDLFAPERP